MYTLLTPPIAPLATQPTVRLKNYTQLQPTTTPQQTQKTDTLAGMPYYHPVMVQPREGMELAKDFTQTAMTLFDKFTNTRFGKAALGKVENFLGDFFKLDLNPVNPVEAAKKLSSQAELERYAGIQSKTNQFRQGLAGVQVSAKNQRAEALNLFTSELQQSGSATVAQIIEYVENKPALFNGSLDSLLDLPTTVLHTSQGATGWHTIQTLLTKIREYSPEVFAQQTPEGKEAREKAEMAIALFLSISGHPDTSPMFQWVGHYGAAVLLLRMGDAGLERLPAQLMALESKLATGYQSYINMKEKLPALLPNTANGIPLLVLDDVIRNWPTKTDVSTSETKAQQEFSKYQEAVNELNKSISELHVSEDRYYREEERYQTAKAEALKATDDDKQQQPTLDTKKLEAIEDAKVKIEANYNAAKEALRKANKTTVDFEEKKYLASSASSEEIKAAVAARNYFEELSENWNSSIETGLPTLIPNPNGAKILYGEIKSGFFYGVMLKILQKQMDTAPLEKLGAIIQKGSQAFEMVLASHKDDYLLQNLFEKEKRIHNYYKQKQAFEQAIGMLKSILVSQEFITKIEQDMWRLERDNWEIIQELGDIPQENTSVLLRYLAHVPVTLEDSYLGLAPEIAKSIENSKTFLALDKLFNLQRKLPADQQQQAQQLIVQQEVYEQSLQNLKVTYAKQLEEYLATILGKPKPKESGQLYNQLLITLQDLPVEALALKKKGSQTIEEQGLIDLEKELTVHRQKDWQQSIATLQQLKGLVSENLMDFAESAW